MISLIILRLDDDRVQDLDADKFVDDLVRKGVASKVTINAALLELASSGDIDLEPGPDGRLRLTVPVFDESQKGPAGARGEPPSAQDHPGIEST